MSEQERTSDYCDEDEDLSEDEDDDYADSDDFADSDEKTTKCP